MQTPLQPAPFASAFYRAVWRWHFYAGLACLPFLIMLAVTGGLYLFKNEIDHAVYRSWIDVSARPTPMLSASLLAERAAAALGGRVLLFAPPPGPTQSARLIVRVTATGESRSAFVDPYDGRLLGSTVFGGVTQTIRKVHSLQQFGFYATCLIEIVAGWTLVLLATGLYLWWPRDGRGNHGQALRRSPARRAFWRDLHVVTGVLAAAVIAFLAITGMPWSAVWGQSVQKWATSHGLSRPKPPANVTPEWAMGQRVAPGRVAASGSVVTGHGSPGASHDAAMDHSTHGMSVETRTQLPWSLQRAPVPASGPSSGRSPLSLDQAITILSQQGLKRPYSVTLPGGPDSAFAGTHRTDRAEDVRVIYLDQYTGAVLADVGFDQYGPVGRLVDWGVAVHQGLEYGEANRLVMLAGCFAILLLSVSALVMWWKRRPAGTLGVPLQPANWRVLRGLVLITLPLAIIFPLLGGSLLVALLLDGLMTKAARMLPRRKTA